MPATIPHLSLDHPAEFARRHIGPDDDQIRAMLDVVGADSLDDLIADAVPRSIRSESPLATGEAVPEHVALERLAEIASANQVRTSLIGQGYHGTITPPVIRRNVLENPAWYTAYTPYQPEISQGRLEALLNFQTVVTELTGLDVANASLLDEATACAEAMTIARRQSKVKVERFFVHHDVHPQTLAVLRTRAEPIGVELVVGALDDLTVCLDPDDGVRGGGATWAPTSRSGRCSASAFRWGSVVHTRRSWR